MAMRGRPPQHGSLTNRFDGKILNLVREFTQVHLDSTNPSKQPLGVSQLCNLLQERDIQLRRMKKKQLESSIQRAQSILRSEIVVSSEDDLLEDSDFEEMKDLTLVQVEDVNTLNKLITSQWTTSQSGVSTPVMQNGHQDDGTAGTDVQNVGHTPKVSKRKPANQGQPQSSLKRQKGNGFQLMSLIG
jgi:hypothetical protein